MRPPICEAVKRLRLALGETQRQFAYRTRTAIRTIARWETVRPPKGKSLSMLAEIARDNGFSELAKSLSTDLELRNLELRETVEYLRALVDAYAPQSIRARNGNYRDD